MARHVSGDRAAADRCLQSVAPAAAGGLQRLRKDLWHCEMWSKFYTVGDMTLRLIIRILKASASLVL